MLQNDMNRENINFKASVVAPNNKEVTYWIDLNEDPTGGIIKTFNGTKWNKIKAQSDSAEEINDLAEQIESLSNTKVDKSGSKVLSDVNFTTAYKNKLDSIEQNATNTIIVNNLTSTNTNQALSAAQGKTLKDALDALTSRVSALETPAA